MIGRTIAHFEVIEKLGEGGMGVVFKAQDKNLDRFVALKLLPPESVCNADRRRRFVQEAKSASALNHPNIVHIYEIGEADGALFIAMEYVDGRTLDQLIREGGLTSRQVLKGAVQIADALSTAHAAGIVHRDLKPSNIMVNNQGLVKVLDFGLAKLIDPDPAAAMEASDETRSIHHAAPPRTEEGVILGTAAYMSPEQAEGGKIDARSDVFSFGAVLYEMVTGKRAFSGATRMATLSAVLRDEPASVTELVPAVPAELGRIVHRCLRKDPVRRAQNMADVKVQLEEIHEESLSAARPKSPSADPAPSGPPLPGSATSAPTHSSALPPTPSSVASSTRRPNPAWIAAAAFLVLAAGISLYLWRARSTQTIDSLAVLPFTNVGVDPNTEYLSEGVTESLTNTLGQLPGLRIASRDSASRLKDADSRRAAAQLGVRAILKGKLRQQGDALTISVELVDGRDDSHIWGEHYERKLADLVSVQQQITSDIAERLQRKLSGQDRQHLAKRYSTNSEAYQLYLKGHYELEKVTPEGIAKGIGYIHQAIDADPTFALAYEGLSYGYWMPVDLFTAPHDGMPKAKEAAKKALELDESLAEAHTDLACVLFMYDLDWKGAEKEFRRSIELKPDYARAHEYYSWYLLAVGHREEAVEESRKARQLDPLDLETNWQVGQNFYFAHRYDEAIEQLSKTLEMDSGYWPARLFLGLSYEAKGDLPRAIAEIQRSSKSEPNAPWPLAELGHAYAAAGNKDEANRVLKQLLEWSGRTYFPPAHIATIYAGLGNREQALAYLEKTYEARSVFLTFLPMDPEMDQLRNEPRFKELLQKIGL